MCTSCDCDLFASSINGIRYATAFFITRADFITWGKNIFPEPNKSPTCPIPSINGPSITFRGWPYKGRHSSVSSIIYWSIPWIINKHKYCKNWSWIILSSFHKSMHTLTSACAKRSFTFNVRHSASFSSFLAVFAFDWAYSSNFSVA